MLPPSAMSNSPVASISSISPTVAGPNSTVRWCLSCHSSVAPNHGMIGPTNRNSPMSQAFIKTVLPIAFVVVAIQTGCSGKVRNYPPDDLAAGGGNATGGTLSTGGESSTGGASATSIVSSGGATAIGGATSGNVTGGTSGGIQSTGGVAATNSATGGAMQTGSASSSNLTGGLSSSGGNSSGGGVTATTRTSGGGAIPTGGSGGSLSGGSPTTGGTSTVSTECAIKGTHYTAEQTDPNNACQSCQPHVSTTAWVPVNDGSPCGNGVCVSGNCTCGLGALMCGGCLGWNFESGTQFWVKDSDPSEAGYAGGVGNGAETPTTSTTTPCPSLLCPGSRSLHVGMTMDMQTTSEAGVAVPICPSGGTADLNGHTMSVNAYFAGTADLNVLSVLRAYSWGPNGNTQCDLMWGTAMTVNSWLTGSCQFQASVLATHLAVVVINAGEPWSGTMYLDNVQVN